MSIPLPVSSYDKGCTRGGKYLFENRLCPQCGGDGFIPILYNNKTKETTNMRNKISETERNINDIFKNTSIEISIELKKLMDYYGNEIRELTETINKLNKKLQNEKT